MAKVLTALTSFASAASRRHFSGSDTSTKLLRGAVAVPGRVPDAFRGFEGCEGVVEGLLRLGKEEALVGLGTGFFAGLLADAA